MADWTIQKLLNWITQYFKEKGIDPARLSAEMVLAHTLNMQRIDLYTCFDKPVSRSDRDRLREFVKRAAENEPVQYIIGKTEFYSMEFHVSPDCLIPRCETELLVERAIEFLRKRVGQQYVLDLCTGCGCVAIAIAKNHPDAKIIATDISDPALEIAAKNVDRYSLGGRVELLCGDLFDPIITQLDTAKFDLIVSNPPYISETEFQRLDRNVKDYEPSIALRAGYDGLDIYRRIIEKAADFLKPDAVMMLEIGYAQGLKIRQLLEQTHSFEQIRIEKDYSNNDRITIARKQPPLSAF
ncbi:MAG: peptide chain release factor N(5)-glutamine methyltransferase [Planctomycetota bacterium]